MPSCGGIGERRPERVRRRSTGLLDGDSDAEVVDSQYIRRYLSVERAWSFQVVACARTASPHSHSSTVVPHNAGTKYLRHFIHNLIK